jgi:hypothetical protein
MTKLAQLLPAHARDCMGLEPKQVQEIRRSFVSARAAAAREAAALGATGGGRGPGTGPDASPYNVTLLLLGAWAGCERSKAPAAVGPLFMTPATGWDGQAAVATIVGDTSVAAPPSPVCQLTGVPTFGMAVQAILSDPELAERVEFIEVRQGFNDGTIYQTDGEITRFTDGAWYESANRFHITSNIPGVALVALARSLANREVV